MSKFAVNGFSFEYTTNVHHNAVVRVCDNYYGFFEVLLGTIDEVKVVSGKGHNLHFEPQVVFEKASEGFLEYLADIIPALMNGEWCNGEDERFYSAIAYMFSEVREVFPEWSREI